MKVEKLWADHVPMRKQLGSDGETATYSNLSNKAPYIPNLTIPAVKSQEVQLPEEMK